MPIKSIVALKADKGNATALLDSACYHSNVMAILQDDPFCKLKTDPTAKIEQTLIKLIKNT